MSEQGPPPWEQGGQPAYPRQQLLPQEIKSGRNRKPLFIGLGLAFVLVIGGAVAYVTLRNDGEDTRAAYCAALRHLTHNGDLTTAVEGAGASAMSDLKDVQDLAPNAVSDDWSRLMSIANDAKSGSPDMSQMLTAFGALKSISTDAKENCNLDLGIPMM